MYMKFTPSFSLSCSGDHRDLHSFPTRRSSDLASRQPRARARWDRGGCARALRCVSEGIRVVARRALVVATPAGGPGSDNRSEEHTSELQSHSDLVCRLLLEKKKQVERTHACKH